MRYLFVRSTIFIDIKLLLLLLVPWTTNPVCCEKWKWPDQATEQSVKLDNKVRFVDSADTDRSNSQDIQSDDVPGQTFQRPTNTDGFYSRPAGDGQYNVRVQNTWSPNQRLKDFSSFVNYRDRRPHSDQWITNYDGTLDTLPFCKCTANPDCRTRTDVENPCPSGKFLCCYKRANKHTQQQTEYFNEVEDERPLYIGPGTSTGSAGAFPPPRDHLNNALFSLNQGHESGLLGPLQVENRPAQEAILVGPGGPTGFVGPEKKRVLIGLGGPTGLIGPASIIKPIYNTDNRDDQSNTQHFINGDNFDNLDVLVGPEGPTGSIGPKVSNQNTDVLVGPGGPTGTIGPNHLNEKPDLLVGPSGPTGVIGPVNQYQRPDVLVGPGGPTGIIGPNKQNQRQGLLVGPGGPTGIVGPYRYSQRPDVLVGPGGPTGIIGTNRYNQKQDVLVGPGGPSGIIGPYDQVGAGLLIRPGGPTGTIGPGRRILVGPGGPPGIIGPKRQRNRPDVLVGPGGPTGIIGPAYGRNYGFLPPGDYSGQLSSRSRSRIGGDSDN